MKTVTILIFSFIFFTSVFLSVPQDVVAQGLVTCSGADCTICSLADMTNGIIQWLFGFLTICAVFIFVYAGFRLVTSGGDVGARDYAKDRIKYIIIGFILMLASWLIVDTILEGLTGTGLEVWGSFAVDECGGQNESSESDVAGLAAEDQFTELSNLISQENISDVTTVSPAGVYYPSNNTGADGQFSYQGGIAAQRSHASPELEMLLRCMASQVPSGVGEISSISDSRIVNGSQTWEQCWDGGCAHTARSCHYGNGYGVIGKSYAVDFGDENNAQDLIGSAYACGAKAAAVHNGNHVHVTADACKGI